MDQLSERLAYIYSERPDLEGERGQTGLVKASGASKSVVNQWLNEKIKSMDIRYALEIEKNLGFSHIWLMANIGEPIAKPNQEAAEVIRVSSALLARYWALDARNQRDVDAYIKLVEQRGATSAATPSESEEPASVEKKPGAASRAVFEIDPPEEDSGQSGQRTIEK